MISPRVLTLLGLCQRAGKLVSGDFAAEQALRRRKASLVLLAEDASERTREKFARLAADSGTPCYVAGSRSELGTAIGKADRAVLVIQSRDFTRGISDILRQEGLAPLTGRG